MTKAKIDMTLKVPFGYGRTFVTLAEVEDRLLDHYHPGYVRRVIAWLWEKQGEIGPGSTWRPPGGQGHKPGMAPEGRSFHQDQVWGDGFVGAGAIDFVRRNPDPNGIHLGMRWSDVPRPNTAEAKRTGLHFNVKGEPWHGQGVEYSGWQSWVNGGRKWPVIDYELTITPDTPVQPPTQRPPYVPAPTLRDGSAGVEASRLIDVLKFWHWYPAEFQGDRNNGVIGERSVAGIREMQRVLGVAVDGMYGPRTADAYAAFVETMQGLNPGTPPTEPPAPPAPEPTAVPRPTLAEGSTGSEAFRLIALLKTEGWYPRRHINDRNDGRIGPRAVEGIRNMQRALGVTVDGRYGPRTAAALEAAVLTKCGLPPATLRPGDRSNDVGVLQRWLAARGWYALRVDNRYGPVTAQGVQKLQRAARDAELQPGPIDGIFGPRTRAAGCAWATAG